MTNHYLSEFQSQTLRYENFCGKGSHFATDYLKHFRESEAGMRRQLCTSHRPNCEALPERLNQLFAITRAFNRHRGPLPRFEQSTRQHHLRPVPPHTEAVQKALHTPQTSIFRAGRAARVHPQRRGRGRRHAAAPQALPPPPLAKPRERRPPASMLPRSKPPAAASAADTRAPRTQPPLPSLSPPSQWARDLAAPPSPARSPIGCLPAGGRG